MKYRKKPIIIEAEQWFPEKKIEGVLCEEKKPYICLDGRVGFGETEYFVLTLEGKMMVNPGDYIITGIEGEKYPCKQSIFEKTYEKVEE